MNSSGSNTTNVAENELSILQHVSKVNRAHEGWHFVRRLLDTFTINSGPGTHRCLVLEPLREPLSIYRLRFVGGVLPNDVLKLVVQMILHGLDYLHSECQIIHGGMFFSCFKPFVLLARLIGWRVVDLKPDNILVKIEDTTILERAALEEYQFPLPQKETMDGRVIYSSRNDYGPFLGPVGLIQISDFGFSVSGTGRHTGCIQTPLYRAPEVILDADYTWNADIWSLGVMVSFTSGEFEAF